jgi:uncharacterized metal-binding protein
MPAGANARIVAAAVRDWPAPTGDGRGAMPERSRALVYACSGCSNVAQLANTVAVRLDRSGLAEMSCIAGVGGNVKPLVRKAASGIPILALDGCPLHCVRNCLAQHGIEAGVHVTLSERGLRKRNGESCSPDDADALFDELSALLSEDPRLQTTQA